jgi:ubiquinone/menaquinone biosynthesis C-methylase UbiE
VSFDTLAPWYRTLEWIAFGDTLQRSRVACLGEIAAPRRALIVGEGNGRFVCELLRLYRGVEVDCIDESERMSQSARKRLDRELPGRAESVRFLHQDITSWTPPERHYDLLVTHFVLDCFPEAALTSIIRKLARAATDDANWLLADFCVPANGMAKLRARAWLAAMYLFFRVTARIPASELIDPTPTLRAEGFALVRQHLLRKGMLKSEIWRKVRNSPVRRLALMAIAQRFNAGLGVIQEMSPAQGRREQPFSACAGEHNAFLPSLLGLVFSLG